MSVYIFGQGKSIYNENLGTPIVFGVATTSTTQLNTPQLSTIVLKDNTTVSEIMDYSNKLREELEEIRKIFFKYPKPENMKEYNKFLRVQQQLMNYLEELTELYQSYELALQQTANRKQAIRQKIFNVGIKISSLIRSYNTSGIFASRDTAFVSIPTPNSYEEAVRSRLLQALE